MSNKKIPNVDDLLITNNDDKSKDKQETTIDERCTKSEISEKEI